MALPELLTVTSVAKQLGVTRNTIYNWLDQGMPYLQAAGNGHIWLTEDDVNGWLGSHRAADASVRRKQSEEDHKRRAEEDWNEAYAEAQQTIHDQRFGSVTSDGGIFGSMDRTPRPEVARPANLGGIINEQNIGAGGAGRYVQQHPAQLPGSGVKQYLEYR